MSSRLFFVAALAAATLFIVAQPAAAAAPANDNFADATAVTGASGSLTDQTNVEATTETGEPSNHSADCCDTSDVGSSSVWYTWTAPSSGLVAFDTLGTGDISGGLDTVLGVYTGNALGSLTEVNSGQGFNDDYGGECCESRVVFQATADTTYTIGVGGCCGSNANTGPFVLNWGPATRPANDAFASATAISGGSGIRSSDSNFDATPEAGEPDFQLPGVLDLGGDSIWYDWTAPADGVVLFTTSMVTYRNNSSTPAIAMYTGSLGSLTEQAYSTNGQLTFTATSGTTYKIGLGGLGGSFSNAVYWGEMGDIALAWQQDSTPPDTTISSGSGGKHSVTFAFTGSDDVSSTANLTYECKIDSGAFAACTSPKTFSAITGGSHTVAVRATDESGNVDPTPATRTLKAKGSPKSTS
jgi:hypothetical protein